MKLFPRSHRLCESPLDQIVAENIFDTCVNMGVRTGSRLAQLAFGISPADGIIGSNSLKVINESNEKTFPMDSVADSVSEFAEIYYIKNCKICCYL